MLPTPAKIPKFEEPVEAISPAIHNLLHHRVYEEDGIQFSAYKPINASTYINIYIYIYFYIYISIFTLALFFFIVDPLELQKNSRSATFYYKDANAFVNCKRIFLDITWEATRGDGTPLVEADYVSCLNPPSHNLIQAVTINIGTPINLSTYAAFFFCLHISIKKK